MLETFVIIHSHPWTRFFKSDLLWAQVTDIFNSVGTRKTFGEDIKSRDDRPVFTNWGEGLA